MHANMLYAFEPQGARIPLGIIALALLTSLAVLLRVRCGLPISIWHGVCVGFLDGCEINYYVILRIWTHLEDLRTACL